MSYYKQEEFEDYFWSRSIKQGSCRIWIKGKRNGYGRVIYNKQNLYSHRVAYSLYHKIQLTSEQIVRHYICNNKLCVEPTHLAVGTQAENIADKRKFNTQTFGENSPQSKITEAQVLDARKRYWIDGISHQTIATELGLTSGGMLGVLNGSSWTHIENFKRVRKKDTTSWKKRKKKASV